MSEQEQEGLKKKRSSAKRNVSLAIKKLISSLAMGLDSDSLSQQSATLERFYDELLSTHLEYLDAVPEGEEEGVYMKAIDAEYETVMKLYLTSRKAADEVDRQKLAAPVVKSVDRGLKKVNDLLISLERELNHEDVDLHSLMVTKKYVETDLDALINDMSRLGSLMDISAQNSDVDILVSRAEILKR